MVEDDSPRKRTWSEHNCYGFPRLTKMSSLCICYAYMCVYTLADTCAITDGYYFGKFLYGLVLLNGGFTVSYENVGSWSGL